MQRQSSTTVSHSESDLPVGLMEKLRYWCPVLTFVIASVSLTFTATWFVSREVHKWNERLATVERDLKVEMTGLRVRLTSLANTVLLIDPAPRNARLLAPLPQSDDPMDAPTE